MTTLFESYLEKSPIKAANETNRQTKAKWWDITGFMKNSAPLGVKAQLKLLLRKHLWPQRGQRKMAYLLNRRCTLKRRKTFSVFTNGSPYKVRG